MPCFCPAQTRSLTMLMPSARLSVGAVPWQMPSMIAMLGLGDAEAGGPPPRVDLKMSAFLGSIQGQPWLPFRIPTLMTLSAQLSSVAAFFPLDDLNALIAQLQQALNSLSAHLMPLMASAARLPKLPMANMVLAARMTLSLRAKGLCPMALSGLDHSFAARLGLAPSTDVVRGAISASASVGSVGMPGFGLPFEQLTMALSLAGLAPLASPPPSLSLPSVGSSNFANAGMAMLANLARMPTLPLDVSSLLSQLSRLTDLAAIQQAFGMDAMSSAGVTRVQAMLNFMSRLRLPALPSFAMDLQPKLDMLPTMEAVQAGAQVARLNVPTFSTAMGFSPIKPPVLSALSALNALMAALGNMLGELPASGGCVACSFAA